jgi:hypothetical protein
MSIGECIGAYLSYLNNTSRYYRFNVLRGLEDIKLEESKMRKEAAAVT